MKTIKMKSCLTMTVAFLIAFSGSINSQTIKRNCSSMNYLEQQKKNDPQVEQRMRALENFTQEWVKRNEGKRVETVYTIPVVVHVVYNTTSENISDAQVQSQIAVLTEDFRRTNADKTNTPSTFTSVAADSYIEFCLATKDPNGNATTGITRTSTSTTLFSDNDAVKYNSSGGKDAWPTGSYLNLWVCDLGTGLLGYAQFPSSGSVATDGVVINYRYFGRGGSAEYPFNKGRTASHEVGHWLNLYHIWGDAYCGNDGVSDTPTQQADNAGCPTHPKSNSCGTTAEMFMNYMDYTDDACMNIFSTGQKSRMRALFATGGARVSLLSSTGCGGTATPSYCSASSSNTSYEWISNVNLNTINNTTTASSGYADYTSISTTINKSSAYTISLTPAFASTVYTEYFNVYIDYNADKDFTDAGELVYSSTGGTTTASGSFTVPSTATSGATRMRVMMKDGAITGPCESYTYGEVEDYTVNIGTATATCGTPTGLASSSITSSSATLSWTAVSGAGSYNIRYKPTSSTTWTTTTSTTTSKGVTGLSASTSYEFQVQAVCSGTGGSYSASSTFTTSAATTPSYCSASSSNTSYEWISNVNLNTINNTTTGSGGYADYTSLSTTINKSSAYTISLTPSFASSTYTEYFNVYIDYNADKDFTDAGELVYSSTGGTTTASGSFTVPSTATSGATRMRVMMKDGAITGPCEAYTYGEVEDYTVNIGTATATCGTPTGLASSSITSSSATLSWAAVSGAGSYNIRYKPTSSTTWTTTTSTSTSKSVTGLTASTAYEFQVQAVCSGTGGSYSGSATFTTSATSTVTSATLTVGTGTGTTGVTPYGTYYMDERTQFIITKAELVAAGYTSVNSYIRSLAFNTTTASSQTMYGFTIKIAHTSSSSFGTTSFLTGTFTTVYSANVTAVANSWVTHNFTSAFAYNGTSNLLIDICWNNSTYTTNTNVKYTATSSYTMLSKRSDVASGGLCSTTSGTRSYNRPNMRMVFKSSATGRYGETESLILEDETITESPVKIYPNPTSSIVNISFEFPMDNQVVFLKIYDMSGRLVMNESLTNPNTESLSISHLNEGLYNVLILTGEDVYSKKLIITR